MFGLVEKDIFLSNSTISGQTVAGKLIVPNVIYPISQDYPAVPIGPYSVITIPPLGSTTAPVTYNLTVDSTNSEIGDQVIILFDTFGDQTITVNLPANVYYTWLGNTLGATSFTITAGQPYNLPLLWQGTKFINTFEFS